MSRIFGTQLGLGDSTFPMSFVFAKTIMVELKDGRWWSRFWTTRQMRMIKMRRQKRQRIKVRRMVMRKKILRIYDGEEEEVGREVIDRFAFFCS